MASNAKMAGLCRDAGLVFQTLGFNEHIREHPIRLAPSGEQ